jgi:hypothetical protein
MLSVEILTYKPHLVLDVHGFEKITSKDIEFQVDVYRSRKKKSKRFSLLSKIKKVAKVIVSVAKSIDRFIQRFIPRNEASHRKYSELPTAESVKIHVQRYEKRMKLRADPVLKNGVCADATVVNVKTKYPVSIWRKV